MCPSRWCPLRVRARAYSPAAIEPRDRFHMVYMCMVLAGAGFLFPWFSFISAVDYFLYLYREDFPHISEAIPLTYLLTTLLSSTFNVATVNKFPIHCRIAYGYVMFTAALLFVPLLDIGISNCTVSTHISFYLTLLPLVVVGLGSGVQQTSYYGLSSMLPRRYTQALMAGESVAGLVVIISRIITKASFSSERAGAIAFFTVSLVFILVCVCCQVYIRASPFVQWHIAACQQAPPQQSGDIPLENLSEPETTDQDQLIACDQMKSRDIPLESLSEPETTDQDQLIACDQMKSRDIPLEGLSEPETTDQDQLIASALNDQSKVSLTQRFMEGLGLRLLVVRQTWRLIVAIIANYSVTLVLFPGLLSEVTFDPLGDWTPILLVSIFNTFDFIAKCLALIPLRCSPTALMAGALTRVIFIPLVLLCVSPSPSWPILHQGVIVWASLLACGLGITNGYYGSVPLINVSREVKDGRLRELAGTVLVWFLLGALTVGSILGYALTPLTELDTRQSNNSHFPMFDTCTNGSNA